MLIDPNTRDIYWMMLGLMITGFGGATSYIFPHSMKADVIDLDKLESGEDRAALFFAVWSFVSKLSYSFGPWFALILLGSSGFNTAPEALNTPDQLFGLRFLYALSTTLFFGMTIFIIFNFSLNKSRQEEIRKEIELLNQQEGN